MPADRTRRTTTSRDAAEANDFQNHSLPRCRDPDFPLRTLNLFPTNDAKQRRSSGIQEAGQLSSLDISVPHCVCCSPHSRQVGLDVVVVTLTATRISRPPIATVARPSTEGLYRYPVTTRAPKPRLRGRSTARSARAPATVECLNGGLCPFRFPAS